LSGHGWAGYYLSDGSRLVRASSTLLNPNVLGLWGTLIIFLVQYFSDKKLLISWHRHLLNFLGLGVLFISGSRSALIFCFAVLLVGGLLKKLTGIRLISALKSPAILFFIFLLICAGSKLTAHFIPTISPLVLLANRFLDLPQELYFYLAETTFTGKQDLIIKTVTEGRIYGGDNGYRAIVELSFNLFYIWILLLLFFVIMGISMFWKQRNLQGVYALSSLFGFIIIGLFLRAYQLFPVWALSALMSAIFFNWVIKEEIIPDKGNH